MQRRVSILEELGFPLLKSPAAKPGWRARKTRRRSLAEQGLRKTLASADIVADGDRPWDIQVHNPHFYERVLAEGTLGFGESYMDGWWDCDAVDEMCCRAIRARLCDHAPANLQTVLSVAASVILNLQNKHRSRHVAERHYDLGNDFFEAMLDPEMQYSCAYFRGTDDLAAAQRLKLDLIFRKLGLKPGMRLLDIGCGWGGLARIAARDHGCDVVGITISREQQAHAANACRGLPMEIRLQDYRELSEPFDRIVSVGMMEHVGHKNFRAYFSSAHRCLAEGGLFLCHTIGGLKSQTHTDPWIERYIFPNSMIPSAAQIASAADGLFVVEDVQNFGADYDQTLLSWEKNFSAAWPRFADRYGERFRRMWRFYLLSCAGAFRARDLQVYQFLLSKGGVPGGFLPVR